MKEQTSDLTKVTQLIGGKVVPEHMTPKSQVVKLFSALDCFSDGKTETPS